MDISRKSRIIAPIIKILSKVRGVINLFNGLFDYVLQYFEEFFGLRDMLSS